MNKITGYKAFDNMKDQYGNSYEVNKEYTQPGTIKFGTNGFHFCTHIADVLRYCDGFNDNTIICLVEASGEIDVYQDEYNEYFDMYSSSNLKIVKVLSREEIMDIALSENVHHVIRFIKGYKLTDEEINQIMDLYPNSIIKDYIDYYQKNDQEAFIRKRK